MKEAVRQSAHENAAHLISKAKRIDPSIHHRSRLNPSIMEYSTTIMEFNTTTTEEELTVWEDNVRNVARYLKNNYYYFPWQNTTDANANNFDSTLTQPEDVSVDAVVSSLYFNTIVFICLMGSYELLRRLLPAVYSSRQRQLNTRGWRNQNSPRGPGGVNDFSEVDNGDNPHAAMGYLPEEDPDDPFPYIDHTNSLNSLPDQRPLDWIGPVFGIPWEKVRSKAGLDGYFFLRYIRMCVRITAVSSFWALLILVPIYGTGEKQEGAEGWYHISIANISTNSWRMWVPAIFAIFFSGFTFFVMKQEYKHFLNQRMEFLGAFVTRQGLCLFWLQSVDIYIYILHTPSPFFHFFIFIHPKETNTFTRSITTVSTWRISRMNFVVIRHYMSTSTICSPVKFIPQVLCSTCRIWKLCRPAVIASASDWKKVLPTTRRMESDRPTT